MIFGQDRDALRAMYKDAWRKKQDGLQLTALEAQIATVISEHPEYTHAITGDLEQDYTVEGGETNPFLHMGLHLGIREQVATNRPTGIRDIFTRLSAKIGDAHGAEHRMIDCLAEALWEAQRQNRAPDEQAYLRQLRRLLD